MRKLINNTKQISINELLERLCNSSDKVIVFYRSSNKPDGIPCFLQTDSMGCFSFRSPIFQYNETYSNLILRKCLEEASKARDIYVLDKEDSDELFKLQR